MSQSEFARSRHTHCSSDFSDLSSPVRPNEQRRSRRVRRLRKRVGRFSGSSHRRTVSARSVDGASRARAFPAAGISNSPSWKDNQMKSVFCTTFVSSVALIGSAVFAQFSADAKISGNAFRHGQAQTYQRHARDYSQMLYYEARCEEPVNPQSAKQQVAAVRRNVDAANKALDKIKETNASKPEVAKRIDRIKERHAKVIVKCDELDQHLAKADKDTTVVCDCCVELIEELDAAAAETEKLRDDLNLKPLPSAAKASSKSGKSAADKK
ncbi:MAG: hypothetical protein ACT4QC_06610 [Planctomycetaceae bacterium]